MRKVKDRKLNLVVTDNTYWSSNWCSKRLLAGTSFSYFSGIYRLHQSSVENCQIILSVVVSKPGCMFASVETSFQSQRNNLFIYKSSFQQMRFSNKLVHLVIVRHEVVFFEIFVNVWCAGPILLHLIWYEFFLSFKQNFFSGIVSKVHR